VLNFGLKRHKYAQESRLLKQLVSLTYFKWQQSCQIRCVICMYSCMQTQTPDNGVENGFITSLGINMRKSTSQQVFIVNDYCLVVSLTVETEARYRCFPRVVRSDTLINVRTENSA
jgi:hypothetical protein